MNQTFTLLSILSIRIHCWFLKCKPLDFSTYSKVKTEMTKDNANTVQFQTLSWKWNITFTFSTVYSFTTVWHKSTLNTQGLTFSGSLDLVNLFIFPFKRITIDLHVSTSIASKPWRLSTENLDLLNNDNYKNPMNGNWFK